MFPMVRILLFQTFMINFIHKISMCKTYIKRSPFFLLKYDGKEKFQTSEEQHRLKKQNSSLMFSKMPVLKLSQNAYNSPEDIPFLDLNLNA